MMMPAALSIIGGSSAGGPPKAVQDMLATTPAGMKDQLAGLLGRDALMGQFVRQMRTTFLVATAVLLMGALVAPRWWPLLSRNHVVTEPAVANASGTFEAAEESPIASS